jgi:hypothetical protein
MYTLIYSLRNDSNYNDARKAKTMATLLEVLRYSIGHCMIVSYNCNTFTVEATAWTNFS